MPSAPLITAWSYSRFATYDQCPLKFKLQYLDKLPDPPSAAMARGNEIHSVAENYIQLAATAKVKLPVELANVAREADYLRSQDAVVEQAWGFKADWSWTGRQGWFGDDVWFRAKADAVVVYDDDTALLIDWKSGKKYETNEDQVRLFALAAKMRYPQLKEVDTRLWYVDVVDDNEVQREFKGNDFENIRKDWERKVVPMFNDRKFPPTPGQKCRWCNFSKAKGGPCKY